MALPIKKALAAIKNPSKFKYIKYFDKLPIDEKTILVESQHASEFNGNVFYISRFFMICGGHTYHSGVGSGIDQCHDRLLSYQVMNYTWYYA